MLSGRSRLHIPALEQWQWMGVQLAAMRALGSNWPPTQRNMANLR